MKQFFSSLGSLFSFSRAGKWRREGYSPYTDRACNHVYNLLFCDKPALFRRLQKGEPQGNWKTLLSVEPYAAGLKAIAEDKTQPSRERILAYNRLRERGEAVVPRELLGTIVEVKLPDGLDVLAAYEDCGVHYIHHREIVTEFVPAPVEWRLILRRLMDASQTAVDCTGPWVQPRVAPPTEGMIRMSFLVSDGLYFGQGLINVMDKDELAGPIIAASTELLKSVTRKTTS
jgi:hypothetical protein